MHSPIDRLLPQITKSVTQTIPDHSERVLHGAKRARLRPILIEHRGFHFKTDPRRQAFLIPKPALEYIWMSIYTYYVLFEICDAYRTQGQSTFKPRSHPDMAKILDFLNLAHQQVYTKHPLKWPTLPRTLNDIPVMAIADTIFLRCLEYLLLPSYLSFLKDLTNIRTSSTDYIHQRELTSINLLMVNAKGQKDKFRRAIALLVGSLLKTANTQDGYPNTLQQSEFNTVLSQLPDYFKHSIHTLYFFVWVVFHEQMHKPIPLTPYDVINRESLLLSELTNPHPKGMTNQIIRQSKQQ
ncbi:hypothetical protein [Teredinibacter sp. KSP-S5-2]|uniref:hypothetical protein n=1 Tax=Teredinibacter sp. KSP-S5-2 TaxID=3034506 RepID=UPI0029349A84|nr:hypothetical protein [Teredinibacter sp. KSP-S5-2]WNO10458.1 hypothetical protein P5V12_04665 [Teredinibacter sp. KSP-S5-2]